MCTVYRFTFTHIHSPVTISPRRIHAWWTTLATTDNMHYPLLEVWNSRDVRSPLFFSLFRTHLRLHTHRTKCKFPHFYRSCVCVWACVCVCERKCVCTIIYIIPPPPFVLFIRQSHHVFVVFILFFVPCIP